MTQKPQAKYRKDYQAPHFTITDINLEFNLHPTKTVVVATSQVAQRKAGEQDLFLDGDNLTLLDIQVNGVSWAHYTQVENGLHVTQLPEQFTLSITTQIDPSANTALEGLYLADGAYCTQCEAEGFRRITYYLDRPDVLATFTTTVIAEKSLPYLLSNGNKIDSGELSDGRHWVKWQDPFAKPCYLFALVAGDFDVLTDSFRTKSARDVSLEIYVDKGNLSRAEYAMTSLKNAMKWDEERFGLEYDLDIYMIVAVDFFNMGAMENKGLNVFNSKFVLADEKTATDTDYQGIEAVIGHEYFHNWTGNRVTCRDWFQLSLKEGLTVFRDQEFSSDLGSRAVNRIDNVRIIRGPQFAEDASPMSHPIRPEKVIEMNNFYTLTVYEKGSEVIRMMHTLLGEDGFQKGMQLYFSRHDGTAATCDDFVAAMQDASGVDLTAFTRWYSQSGTPEVSVRSHYDETQQQLRLTMTQHTPATKDQQDKQPLVIPVSMALYRQDGSEISLISDSLVGRHIVVLSESEQEFVFERVDSVPVISLLQDFSAPVKLHIEHSDEELRFLMMHAANDFSRWDASQSLLAKYIKQNVANVQQGNAVALPDSLFDAFSGVLQSAQLDPALISAILTLPSENEIGGWYQQIDVDAIHQVRDGMRRMIAKALADTLAARYREMKSTDHLLTHEAMAKRALRNTCLQYLAFVDEGEACVQAHFASATNMTETIAALTAANQAQLPNRAALMTRFSDSWQHEALVMDKWLMLQGTNPAQNALENVKAQLSNPAFSMKNPNRVRALIGSFCQQNPVHFHAADGSGYAFLADRLVELNTSNPQVAARLIDPLLKLKYFDNERQLHMRAALTRLAALDNLSNDLFEKINNALAD